MDTFRILIVDDEEELVNTLVERLEIRGFPVVGVLNGKDAIKAVKEQEFDVVVLDMKMPGDDGVEIMKQIKKIKWDLPVLLLTGHMSQEASDKALQMGAIDYIIKPIKLRDLIAKMQEAINVSKQERPGK